MKRPAASKCGVRSSATAVSCPCVPAGRRTTISAGGDTWSVGSRAGDFIFVAGMQGINPSTNKLVDGDEARIRQAF